MKEYNVYALDLDKVETLEDCKKILQYLCSIVIKPTEKGMTYAGFETVKDYFRSDAIS